LSRARRIPVPTLVRLFVGLVVAAVTVTVPVLPASAERVARTLAHNVSVGEAPVRPGFAIEYLGVVWEGEHGPAWARFSSGDRWGDWVELDEDGAQAEGQYGTQLLAAGRATAFQVRVPAHARNARAVAINVHDGEQVTVDRGPAATAGAATPVVTRAGWGADESLRFKEGRETWPPAYYDVQKLTVHHSATKNTDPDPAATVRAIYRYHAVDKGWGDIGYQYLVDEAGTVYEGRWSGNDGDVAHDANGDLVTAGHVDGANSGNSGISLLGDFRQVAPTAAARQSLENVLADLAGRHGIDPQGTGTYVNPVNGSTKAVANISAHLDWQATECPGTKLYELLPAVRSNVAAKLGGGTDTGTNPAAPSALTAEATGTKVKGLQRVDLSWTGAATAADVYWKDGAAAWAPLKTGITGSSFRHELNRKGGGTYTYEVRAGTVVSNQVTVTF